MLLLDDRLVRSSRIDSLGDRATSRADVADAAVDDISAPLSLQQRHVRAFVSSRYFCASCFEVPFVVRFSFVVVAHSEARKLLGNGFGRSLQHRCVRFMRY